MENIDIDKLTPMMKIYCETKEQYKDCILFYRLGDFYEMFFDDALTASRELEITLTGKSCGLDERAPMCGIPYHAVEGYLNRLVAKGALIALFFSTSSAVIRSRVSVISCQPQIYTALSLAGRLHNVCQ